MYFDRYNGYNKLEMRASKLTITKCFEKGGVVKVDVEDVVPADAEFDALVKELCYQIIPEELV